MAAGFDNLQLFALIKLWAVEICATAVFIVFVGVEAFRAIRHLLAFAREPTERRQPRGETP